MKLESQITNNHSSIIDNQSKRPSTSVEIALQIHSILTNKPNVKYAKININAYITMSCVSLGHLVIQTNKPNLSQNKANSNPICRKAKIDAKYVYTRDYEDKTVLWLCENKANQSQ